MSTNQTFFCFLSPSSHTDLKAWSRVLTTSAGLTKAAENDPAMHPEMKDHQKTDSLEPGAFLGPSELRLAKRGK